MLLHVGSKNIYPSYFLHHLWVSRMCTFSLLPYPYHMVYCAVGYEFTTLPYKNQSVITSIYMRTAGSVYFGALQKFVFIPDA